MPITNLINAGISHNSFPTTLKCAEVSPVFKKADNLKKGNYRSISVLTGISKMYESVINEQLLIHFVNIFDNLLSAFRKDYSCQSLLLKFVEEWKEALDENKFAGALFMDLSKAFDCLPHSLLIAKLHAYGVKRNACALLADYLTDRRQRVKLLDIRSSWVFLSKGVPQGSILGPILFNVFINDMFYFMEQCKLYNYANDNSLSKISDSIDGVMSGLKHDCQISMKWFKYNGMEAHPTKFQFLLASSQPLEQQVLRIDENTVIASEDQVKALGVIIDNKMSFTQHISTCCTKAARQLNALARISKHLDLKSRKLIYNSFIVSNFNYCPLVWHFCGVQNNNKIEKIQERALRILYQDYTSPYSVLVQNAGTTTIFISRLKYLLIEVFKCLNRTNSACLNDMFSIKQSPYSLRDPLKLVQPKRNTVRHGLRSFTYAGAKLWNELPIEMKDLRTIDLSEFKTCLKNWNGPLKLDDHSHLV